MEKPYESSGQSSVVIHLLFTFSDHIACER
jgi:hypothetical protein